MSQTMLQELVQRSSGSRPGWRIRPRSRCFVRLQNIWPISRRSQKSKNNSPRYVLEIMAKLRRIVDSCGWRTVMQITASDVQGFLADLREGGLSVQTSNHYLRAIKSLTAGWSSTGGLKSNPLDSLSTLNVRVDRRHDRRPLSQDEFTRLIKVADVGPPAVGLCGRDRAMLYILAAWTGLRRGEIGSLTLRNFRLDADPPTVTVEASYSKHRREDRQILHPDLVKRLRKWLRDRKPSPAKSSSPSRNVPAVLTGARPK